MIITTTENIPNQEISEVFGIVKGSTVRARNAVRDWLAGFKNMIGGELSDYTKLLADSKEQAIKRMEEDAQRLGADAIVCVRISSSFIGDAAEVLAYGTAVKLK